MDWTLGLVAGRRQQKGVGDRQAGRVTRRVETAGIERCEKPPHEERRRSGWGRLDLVLVSMKGGERVGCEETGWANLSTSRKDIAHWPMGTYVLLVAPLMG